MAVFRPFTLVRVLITLVLLLALKVTAQSMGEKRGLPFNDPTLMHHFAVTGSQVSWSYNWYSATWENPPSLEFVPMLWCPTEIYLLDAWNNNAEYIIDHSPHPPHLLTFQEPDNAAQCNILPLFAANSYYGFINRYKGRALLGAPAVSSHPGGLDWLTEFFSLCATCEIDFVPIHWYGSALDVANFYAYVARAHDIAGNRPIWVTEIYASGTEEEQQLFLKQVMPWLDLTYYVERYAWFGVFPGNLVNEDGSLTALGTTYAFYR